MKETREFQYLAVVNMDTNSRWLIIILYIVSILSSTPCQYILYFD